jgi:integrase
VGCIFLRIIHKREVKEISTPHHLYSWEWNESDQQVVLPVLGSARLQELLDIEDSLGEEKRRAGQVLKTLGDRECYTASDVARLYLAYPRALTLSSFAGEVAATLIEEGRERTARAYMTAARRLEHHAGAAQLKLEKINAELLRGFVQRLKEEGRSLNTISFYVRNLRAIYNKALAREILPSRKRFPFTGLYGGVPDTRKRALSTRELQAIALIVSERSTPEGWRRACPDPMQTGDLVAAALFLFSFHAWGMSYIDMAYLERLNIKEKIISYCRKKTGRVITVFLNDKTLALLNYLSRQAHPGSPYILPIIHPGKGSDRERYENALRQQNTRLKRVARAAGLTGILSTHVARHSWATLARSRNVTTALIGEALGHRDERTTHIYLGSFDESVLTILSDEVSHMIT